MSCLQLSITFFILHRLTPNDPKSFQNDIGQCTVSSFFFLYSCYRDHYIQISYLNILCFLVSLILGWVWWPLRKTNLKPLFSSLRILGISGNPPVPDLFDNISGLLGRSLLQLPWWMYFTPLMQLLKKNQSVLKTSSILKKSESSSEF